MEEKIIEFLDYIKIEKKLSKNTILSYSNDLKLYHLFLGDNIKFNDIKRDDVIRFIKSLEGKELSPRSINHIIGVIKEMHAYYSMNYNIPNVTEDIHRLKTIKSLPKVLSVNEVSKLLDIEVTDGYSMRNKAMLELMYSSGLRVSELINLTLNDVDLTNDIIRIYSYNFIICI